MLPQAGRLSGLYDGGADLDALGRACMAFHTSRHESPVLDVHALAAHLRATQAAERQRKTAAHHHHHHEHEHEAAVGSGVAGAAVGCDPCLEALGLSAGGSAAGAGAAGVSGSGGAKEFGVVSAEPGPRPPSLLLRPPGDSGFVPGTIHPADVGKPLADTGGRSGSSSSGKMGGYDLGHLSFTCVTSASLADDFLGEVIRQTTAGHAAAEVAAAAAAAATVRAAKCAGLGQGGCSCADDVAAAQAAAAAAAAAAERLSSVVEEPLAPAAAPSLPGIGHAHGADEDELFEAVTEELNAVAEAAILAERDAEAAADAAEAAAAAAAAAGGDTGAATAAHHAAMASASNASSLQQSLKGAFAHRVQLMPGVFYSYFIGSQAFTNTAVSCGKRNRKAFVFVQKACAITVPCLFLVYVWEYVRPA